MPTAPAVGYMPGARTTQASPSSIGPALTNRGASSLRPAAMYPFSIAEQTKPVDEPVQDEGLCIETTKSGKPCKAKRVLDTEYCFSHVRKHRGSSGD